MFNKLLLCDTQPVKFTQIHSSSAVHLARMNN